MIAVGSGARLRYRRPLEGLYSRGSPFWFTAIVWPGSELI
jgi:hypothetical protein